MDYEEKASHRELPGGDSVQGLILIAKRVATEPLARERDMKRVDERL